MRKKNMKVDRINEVENDLKELFGELFLTELNNKIDQYIGAVETADFNISKEIKNMQTKFPDSNDIARDIVKKLDENIENNEFFKKIYNGICISHQKIDNLPEEVDKKVKIYIKSALKDIQKRDNELKNCWENHFESVNNNLQHIDEINGNQEQKLQSMHKELKVIETTLNAQANSNAQNKNALLNGNSEINKNIDLATDKITEVCSDLTKQLAETFTKNIFINRIITCAIGGLSLITIILVALTIF